MDPNEPIQRPNTISRRDALRVFGGGILAVSGASALLAACTNSTTSGQANPSGSADIKRGGTLRVGVIGAGTAESLNVRTALSQPDWLRVNSLYERLYILGTDGNPAPSLAESGEHDGTGQVW